MSGPPPSGSSGSSRDADAGIGDATMGSPDTKGERPERGRSADGEATDPRRYRRALLVEKIAIAVSALVVALLLGYALWQLLAVPAAGAPQATIVGTDPTASGGVALTVRLENPRDRGLERAGVRIARREPPIEVPFEDVPARETGTTTVRCPPGTDRP
jgi:hypothetical protein